MRLWLERWNLGIYPIFRVDWACKVLTTLGNLVPHRVKAALLRTHWNGWLTAKRWQKSSERRDCRCCFGCNAPDAIEHYADCSVVSDFARRYLRLPRINSLQNRLADFLVLSFASPDQNQDEVWKQALRIQLRYTEPTTCGDITSMLLLLP